MLWHTSLVLSICFFCGTTEAMNHCMEKSDEGGEFSSTTVSNYGKCITAETADTPAKLEFHGCLVPDEAGQVDASRKLPMNTENNAEKIIVGGTAFECKPAEGSDQEPPVLWHSLPVPKEMSGCQGMHFGTSYDIKDGGLWDNGHSVFQCVVSPGKLEFRLKPWGCLRELPGKPVERVPVGTAWTLPGDPPGKLGKEYKKQTDHSCFFSPIGGILKRVEETFVTKELKYEGCNVRVKGGKVRVLEDGQLEVFNKLVLQCRVAKDKRDFDLVPWGCPKSAPNWEGDQNIPFGSKKSTDKHWRVQSSRDKKFFYNVACIYDKLANTFSKVLYECEYHDGKKIKSFEPGCVFVDKAKPWFRIGNDRIGEGYLCRQTEKGGILPLVLKDDRRILVPEPDCKQ